MERRRGGRGEEGTLIKDQSREERKREDVCGGEGRGDGKRRSGGREGRVRVKDKVKMQQSSPLKSEHSKTYKM